MKKCTHEGCKHKAVPTFRFCHVHIGMIRREMNASKYLTPEADNGIHHTMNTDVARLMAAPQEARIRRVKP